MNSLEERLNQLKEVKRVDPPPFLYTRLLQRIEAGVLQQVPVKLAWAMVAGLLLLLMLNVSALNMSEGVKENDAQTLARGLQLSNSNELYR